MTCYICHTTLTSYVNKENNIRLHVFPLSRPSILQQWLKFACVPEDVDPGRLVLCTKHFRKEDVIANPLRTHLVKTAVPCFYPPRSDPACDAISLASDVDLGDLEDLFPPEPEENTEGKELAEKVKNQLCRVCGKPRDLLQPIFSSVAEQKHDGVSLAEKIRMYLPVKVEKDDVLPLNICSQCSESLNQWHELNVTCLSADTVLRKVFASETSKGCHEQCGENCREIDKVVSDYFKENGDDECLSPADHSSDTCREVNTHRRNWDKKKQGELNNGIAKKSTLPQCYYCHESFEHHEDHMNHFRDCRELPAMCEICGDYVSHRKDLWKHKSRHFQSKVKNLMCNKCGKCLRSNPALEYHMRVVHEKEPTPKYFCELCCKPMFAKLHYDIHMRNHTSGKIKSSLLVESIQRDEDSLMYVCPVCEEEFEDKLSLIIHLTSRKIIKCPNCSAQIFSEKKFMIHQCRKWSCKYCSKTSYNKRSLLDHQRIHASEKPYKCEKCDATFRSACQKAKHKMSRHQQQPLYECSYCEKKFAKKDSYQEHTNQHLGAVLTCYLCDQTFGGEASLYEHTMKFHKDFNCLD